MHCKMPTREEETLFGCRLMVLGFSVIVEDLVNNVPHMFRRQHMIAHEHHARALILFFKHLIDIYYIFELLYDVRNRKEN